MGSAVWHRENPQPLPKANTESASLALAGAAPAGKQRHAGAPLPPLPSPPILISSPLISAHPPHPPSPPPSPPPPPPRIILFWRCRAGRYMFAHDFLYLVSMLAEMLRTFGGRRIEGRKRALVLRLRRSSIDNPRAPYFHP